MQTVKGKFDVKILLDDIFSFFHVIFESSSINYAAQEINAVNTCKLILLNSDCRPPCDTYDINNQVIIN